MDEDKIMWERIKIFFSKFVEFIFVFISGEFILYLMPNGGKAVLLRTVFVSSLIYLAGISIKSYFSENAILEFSLSEFRHEVSATIGWLGAILGGTYAALYSRFSSQWTYLANLYNQQMSAALAITDVTNTIQMKNYRAWQAAFIEDAVNMHLATKCGFSTAIYIMLEKQEVYNILKDEARFGEAKVDELKKTLRNILNISQ